MSTTVVIARASDDALQEAVITSSVAPLTSYSLLTLLRRDPAMRVRFGSGTVTITWTLPDPVRGDVFVLPWSNLDPGNEDYTITSLTNGAGLNVPVPIPELQANGIARTAIVDLTLAEPNAGTRTSGVWNLVIAGNSANVKVGGAAMLYSPRRTLDALQWGFTYRKEQAVEEIQNEYLSRYRVNLTTAERQLLCRARAEPAEFTELEDWHSDCRGSVFPGLLWPQLPELDAYVGLWQKRFEAVQEEGTGLYQVQMEFVELSKGKPL